MSNEITTLASAINTEHRKAQECAQAAIDHAYEAGRLLVEAKATVPHGEWGAWLAANFEGSDRTARGYMRLANNWEAIAAKRQSSADLSIDGALQLLAAPKDKPDEEPAARPPYWTSREPAENAKQIAMWPDLLDAPTRLYMAMGKTVEDVAAIMGVDVALVRKRLNPRPPMRFHAQDWYGKEELELYRDTVQGWVEHHHWCAYSSAGYLARVEAPHLVEAMETLANMHRQRWDASPKSICAIYRASAEKHTPQETPVTWLAMGFQLDVTAIKEFRAAIGLENIDRDEDLWKLANNVMRLDVAMHLLEHFENDAPLPDYVRQYIEENTR